MANNIESVKEIQKEIDKIIDKIKGINKEIVDSSKAARTFSDEIKKASFPNQVNEQIEKIKQSQSLLIEQTRERQKQQRNLTQITARLELVETDLNKALVKQRVELQQQNKIIKETAVISSRFSTLLQKTSALRNKEARIIQDLNVKKALGLKLSDKEQKELKQSELAFKKYDKAVRSAKESVGRFQENVGNYPKLLGSITDLTKGLIGSFGVIEGVRLAFDFATESLELAREARGVEFAFKRLGFEGEEAFNKIKRSTRGLLSDLDIKRSLNEFNNFNISLEQTDTLFEFLAVRAAQTGRSVDSLKDSLVEGLSKESKLRIDNLGISAAKLNKELEKTPDFVQAVANIAKEEISVAGNILDEAASSQEKFNAALENLKVSVGSGFIGDLANLFFDVSTNILSMVSSLNNAYDVMAKKPKEGSFISTLLKSLNPASGLSAFNDLLQNSKDIDALDKEFLELDKNSINELNAAVDSYRLLQEEVGKDSDLFFILEQQIGKVEKAITAYYERAQEEYNKNKLNTEKEALSIRELREEIKRLNSMKEELTINDIKRRVSIDKEIKKNQDLIDTILGVNKAYKKIETLTDPFKKALETSVKLRKVFNDLFEKDLKINPEIDIDEEALQRYREQVIKDDEIIKLDKETLENAFSDLSGTIEQFTGANSQVFDKFFEGIRNGFEDIPDIATSSLDVIGEVTNAFYNSSIDSINAQLDANNEYYDKIISNEELSDEVRKKAEKDREDREKKLLQKRRKEQKKQAEINKALAITDILINTAVGIVNALKTGNVPLAITVGAIGAAQLAIAATTPIPQFKDGHLQGTYEGAAMINDAKGNNYVELIERKNGNLEAYKQRNQLIHMNKGDKVHKASSNKAKEYLSSVSNSDLISNLNNHTMMASLQGNINSLLKLERKQTVSEYKTQTDRLINAFKKHKTPIILNNNNSIGDDLDFLSKLNF
jgi:hypothetical protein